MTCEIPASAATPAVGSPVFKDEEEELARYLQTAARRELERASKMKVRMAQTWEFARKAAKVLREQYHAERVVVFDSLLHETQFTCTPSLLQVIEQQGVDL